MVEFLHISKKQFHIIKRWLLLLTLLCGLAISSGCTSGRSTINLKPPKDAATLSTKYKFRLDKIQYIVKERSKEVTCLPLSPSVPPNKQFDALNSAYIWDEAKWYAELKKTVESRYPAIFTPGQGSYPLSVSLKVLGRMPGVVQTVSVVLLCGVGILPVLITETIDFEVSPILSLDSGMTQVPLSTVQFQRKDVSWFSLFTPLGLIPVPGRADLRFTFFGIFPDMTRSFAFNVEACADAIVLSLQSSEADIKKALSGRSPGIGIGIVAP